MKYITNSFGPNALRGHVWLIVLGAVLTVVDALVFQKVHDVRVAMAIAAMAIFATLRLPAAGMDKSEQVELFLLTFAPSAVFGTILGSALGTPLFPKMLVAIGGLSVVASTFALVSIYISYYMCGQLSRDFRQALFLLKVGPGRGFALKALITQLKLHMRHKEADRIIKAFLDCRKDGTELISKCDQIETELRDRAALEYLGLLLG